MSEEVPKRYSDEKPKNPNHVTLRELRSDEDLNAFYQYMRRHIDAILQMDPDGYLAESIRFQRFSDECIVAHPIENDDGSMQFYIDAYRSCAKGNRSIQLGDAISGGTFGKIAQHVEDEIIALPRNALEFIQLHTDGIPMDTLRVPSVHKTPEVTPYTVAGLGNDTRFSDSPTTYTMKDYREYDLQECIQRAQSIRDTVLSNLHDDRYEKFALDVAPNDPWTLRLHRYKRDWIRRYKALFNETEHIPGVQWCKSSTPPPGYTRDKKNNVIAPYDEVLLDYSPAVIHDLRSKLEELRQTYESILLYARPFKGVYDEEANGQGEFMQHPDLADKNKNRTEGVIVECFTCNY